MTAKEAVELAEKSVFLCSILIGGMHCVTRKKSAEKAESRGAEFSWLLRHEGKIVAIPNYDTRE